MATLPIFAPDGTLGDIPADKFAEAVKSGYKVPISVKMNGQDGYIPHDQYSAYAQSKLASMPNPQAQSNPNAVQAASALLGSSGMFGAVKNAISGAYHGLVDPATPQESAAIQATGGGQADPVSRTIYRAAHSVIGPQVDQLQQAVNPNISAAERVGHGIMGAIPVVGPMAANFAQNVGQHIGAGDNTAAISDVGNLLGNVAMLKGGEAASAAPSAIADLAVDGGQDAAALKGLGVGAKSKAAVKTLDAVTAQRPLLEGATDLEDFKNKVEAGKQTIWQPYKDAIDKYGYRAVNGPDGPTTLGALEQQRLETSAQLRALKAKDPEAVQLALQKGQGQAELLQKDAALRAAIDPELKNIGVDDPEGIRKNFAQMSTLGRAVNGKLTLTEPAQPYGLGKFAAIDLQHPFSYPGTVASGLGDIVAGRPTFSGKPTDVNIQQGFKKPSLSSEIVRRLASK